MNAEDFVDLSSPPEIPADREGGRWTSTVLDAFPDAQFTVDDMIAVDVMRLRDGKIVEHRLAVDLPKKPGGRARIGRRKRETDRPPPGRT